MLGSRAVAGGLDPEVFKAKDAKGVSIAEALREFGLDAGRVGEVARRKEDVLAYAELHIEQGPVLEAEGLPLGVVTAINGFSRQRVTLQGMAGHAGTVPMRLRRDALAAAAHCVLAVESIAARHAETVATVGRIEASPGAINVIPGSVVFTVDVRAPKDGLLESTVKKIREEIEAISARRKIECRIELLQQLGVAECAEWLMAQMEHAVRAEGLEVRRLPSGAGHDGMALRRIADICMLFVRCKDGVSHNPAESITLEDAAAAARVLLRFIENFRK
jgi:allantoate deiminase